jgi:hypothetical protein
VAIDGELHRRAFVERVDSMRNDGIGICNSSIGRAHAPASCLGCQSDSIREGANMGVLALGCAAMVVCQTNMNVAG